MEVLDILSKISFYANAKNIVKFAWSAIRCLASIVFWLNIVVKVSSPAVRFMGRRTLSSDFPVFVSFSNLGKRRETETSLKTRTRMVDYEVRDLETLVLVESDDEDLE